jgi:GNAT superfamily N-acetyltransferase
MVLVRQTVTDEWQILRDIRLAALRDAPDAFLSTYEEQVVLEEADWRRAVFHGGTFLAYLPDDDMSRPAGVVSGYQEVSDTVELVSMWVRPDARGRHVGEELVSAVISWASAKNATSVHLWVMEENKQARMLYERCGFSSTDECQELPPDRRLTEVGMIRLLSPTTRTPRAPRAAAPAVGR